MERKLTKREFMNLWSGDVYRGGELIGWANYEGLQEGDEVILEGTDEAGFYLIDWIDNRGVKLIYTLVD